jgi:hypothetical protein
MGDIVRILCMDSTMVLKLQWYFLILLTNIQWKNFRSIFHGLNYAEWLFSYERICSA